MCDISCKITYDNIKQLSIENDQLSCANSCMEEKKRKKINSKTHIERSQKQEKKYNFTPLNMVKNQNRQTF